MKKKQQNIETKNAFTPKNIILNKSMWTKYKAGSFSMAIIANIDNYLFTWITK